MTLPQLLPADAHNAQLAGHVVPADWINPAPAPRYNLVVLGGGPAGLVAAAGAAGLGAKVALVERALLGGDCLNVGCVPSKALLRCARAEKETRDAAAFGLRCAAPTVDFPAVMERMRRLRASLARHDAARRFASLGIDVFRGAGRFTGRDTLEVAGRTLGFTRAIVATGARPVAPPIPGLADPGFLDNTTLFSLTALPRRLAVIGAGPIGCEMAQAFARFGAAVTLIEGAGRLLPREDEEASRRLESAFRADGVSMILDGKVTAVQRRGESKFLRVERGGALLEIEADEILVGARRAANVEGIGLEEAGIAFDRNGVREDDRLKTSNGRVFAAGDCCSRFRFTHAADAMARIALQNALFFGRKRASALVIPWCTYTDPEVAQVGIAAKEAQEGGGGETTHTVEMEAVDRAVLDGDTAGFCRVHVATKSGRILGATAVAGHGGEMIGELALAMTAGLGIGDVARTILPYPTQAEAWKKLGDAHARGRLTPSVAKWFRRWLAWRR